MTSKPNVQRLKWAPMLRKNPLSANDNAESFISFVNGRPVDITVVDICCDITPSFPGRSSIDPARAGSTIFGHVEYLRGKN